MFVRFSSGQEIGIQEQKVQFVLLSISLPPPPPMEERKIINSFRIQIEENKLKLGKEMLLLPLLCTAVY